MIHKIIKGSYFKGALRYVLDPDKGLLIGGTFGSHQSPSQIAHEMREVAGDRLRKPVFHAVLSLRPGESLSNDQWNEVARRYLAALGYDDTPYVLVRHTNREHDHVHIIASRVRYDGSVVSDRQDRFKGLAAVRELSREYGLSMGASSGRSVLADELRTLIRRAAEGKPSVATFLSRLEASGVRVTAHISPSQEGPGALVPSRRHDVQGKPARPRAHLERPSEEARRPLRARDRSERPLPWPSTEPPIPARRRTASGLASLCARVSLRATSPRSSSAAARELRPAHALRLSMPAVSSPRLSPAPAPANSLSVCSPRRPRFLSPSRVFGEPGGSG